MNTPEQHRKLLIDLKIQSLVFAHNIPDIHWEYSAKIDLSIEKKLEQLKIKKP